MDLRGLSLTRLDLRGGVGAYDVTLSGGRLCGPTVNGGIGDSA